MNPKAKPKSESDDKPTRKHGQVSDTPTQAIESGDPLIQGRTRGHAVESVPSGKSKPSKGSKQ